MTAALATLIAVCAFAVIVSAIAVYQTRRYTSAIVATIFQPEARMSTSATLNDAQSDKVSIAVHNAKGILNVKDVASWTSSDEAVVKVSATDPFGRVAWLIGENAGEA